MQKGAPLGEETCRTTTPAEAFVLRLYVSGMTPRSTEALAMIKQVCDRHLSGNYELEVVDVYQHPELAREERVLVLPTLVRRRPEPLRRLIGNLASDERILRGLGLGN